MHRAMTPSLVGNLPYERLITTLLTRLQVDLVDERIHEDTFFIDLDWEAICRMGKRDVLVSDEERNAMRRPLTRVTTVDAEAATVVAAEVAAEAHESDDKEDDDRMYMDVDAIPPPSQQHSTRAGPSRAPSHSAGPSRPQLDDMMGLLLEIWEADRTTDQRIADLAASLQVTQTQVAWLTRVYAEDYDRDREAPPPPAPPAS
ncbi:hypothetical protein NE237_014892 [Protea cynaroides]|uniref:Uncharacterized protein n=1 Tax=Protea cynaroides TaxID=273540 RepID=A0A9Q0KD76_9MAGN|nr:hypothetical protein NE237_014892 [Protea cynaroides]